MLERSDILDMKTIQKKNICSGMIIQYYFWFHQLHQKLCFLFKNPKLNFIFIFKTKSGMYIQFDMQWNFYEMSTKTKN